MKISNFLVHILFAALLGTILFVPDRVEVPSHVPFIAVAAAAELVIIALHKKENVRDIGCVIFIFFEVWELFTSKLVSVSSYLIPSPENVLDIYITDRQLILQNIITSTGFLAAGFITAVLLGLLLGVIVGWYKGLREIFMPIVKVITPIPPLIYSAYLVALLPSFRDASVAIIFLGVFWGMFLSVIFTVSTIDKKLVDSVAVLNLSQPSIFLHILLPYSLPSVLARLSNSISVAFMVLISAEMLGGSSGMGWYIKYSTIYGEYDKTISGIILIAVYVTLLNLLVNKLKKVAAPWDTAETS